MLVHGIIGIITFLFGYFASYVYFYKPKQKVLPQPINVIGGVVLPEPDDPRWYNDLSNGLVLGKIVVYKDRINFDSGGPSQCTQIVDNNKYQVAILRAMQARVAEDSILNAQMPPKRQIKATKKVKALSPISNK